MHTDAFTMDADDVRSVYFQVNEAKYQIYLNPKGRQRLIDALAPFVARAEELIGTTLAPPKPAPVSVVPVDNTEIPSPVALREWARENGFIVGARGRISQDITDAYAKWARERGAGPVVVKPPVVGPVVVPAAAPTPVAPAPVRVFEPAPDIPATFAPANGGAPVSVPAFVAPSPLEPPVDDEPTAVPFASPGSAPF